MRDRLVGHLYQAISHDPVPRLALRIRHADGCAWSIVDEVLTLATELDETLGAIDLSGITLADVVERAEALGCDVAFANQEFLGYGAEVLIEGNGRQSNSNGDHLYAFESLAWSLMSSYARQTNDLGVAIKEAVKQTYLDTAEESWLDLWGASLGFARYQGMSDPDYLQWIVDEVVRPRNTPKAIEKAVNDALGKQIEVREPWKLMHRLDISALSGTHHFPGDYYSYFVIHPVAQNATNWGDVLAVINRNRPAGVEVYAPSVEYPVSHVTVQPPVEYLAERAGHTTQVFGAWPGGEVPLGVMRLCDNEFTLNHRMMSYQLRTYANSEGLQTNQLVGRPRNVAYASMALSDGAPLGDENAILSRGQERILSFVEYGNGPSVQWAGAWNEKNWYGDVGVAPIKELSPALSGALRLSAYRVENDVRRVERVTIDAHRKAISWHAEAAIHVARNEIRAHGASAYDELNAWSKGWANSSWAGWREVGSNAVAGPIAVGADVQNGQALGEMPLSEGEFIFNHPMTISHDPA